MTRLAEPWKALQSVAANFVHLQAPRSKTRLVSVVGEPEVSLRLVDKVLDSKVQRRVFEHRKLCMVDWVQLQNEAELHHRFVEQLYNLELQVVEEEETVTSSWQALSPAQAELQFPLTSASLSKASSKFRRRSAVSTAAGLKCGKLKLYRLKC